MIKAPSRNRAWSSRLTRHPSNIGSSKRSDRAWTGTRPFHSHRCKILKTRHLLHIDRLTVQRHSSSPREAGKYLCGTPSTSTPKCSLHKHPCRKFRHFSQKPNFLITPKKPIRSKKMLLPYPECLLTPPPIKPFGLNPLSLKATSWAKEIFSTLVL